MQPDNSRSPLAFHSKPVGAGSSALLHAVSFFVAVAISFFLSPYMLRRLGDAPYGLLSVTWELGGYFGLLDFGLRSAINYHVSRSAASGSLKDVQNVIRNAFWLLASITAVGVLVSWPLAGLAAGWIRRGPIDLATTRAILWLGILVFSINLTGTLSSAVLAGLRRFDWITATNICGSLLTGLLVFATIHAGMGLIAVALAQAAGTVLPWITQQALLSRWRLTSALWPPRLDRPMISQLASFGSANLAMRVSELLAFQSEQILIVYALGPAAVARYHIGRFLAAHSRTFVSSLSISLAPYFTTLSVQDGLAAQREFFLRFNRWISAAAALLLAGVACLGKDFLVLWVGRSYTEGDWWSRSDVILAILSIAMAARSLSAVPYQFLLGTRRLRLPMLALFLEGAITVVGGLIALRWKGIAALAFVKLATSLLVSVCTLVPYSLRKLRIPLGEFARLSLLPALLVASATAAAATLTRFWLPIDNWPRLFLAAMLSAAAGAAAFLSVSTATDREFLLRKLRTPLG